MDSMDEDIKELDLLQLPNEVWTIILEHVERTDDLLACRQVNRLWHSITTPICRRRFLRPNFSKFQEDVENNLSSFYSTFKNCTNLPWSALQLQLYPSYNKCRRRLSTIALRKFIHHYGSHIHELTIGGSNNSGLLSIMNGLPNIQYLYISWIQIEAPIRESFTGQLGKLKGLIASIDCPQDFRFLELLLNRPEVKLRSLQLTLKYQWLIERYEVLSTLIAVIPILHLELSGVVPDLYIQLTMKKVQVRQLLVHLDAPFAIPDFYSSLETFLQNTSNSLEKLTLLDDPNGLHRGNVRLTIPPLPQLIYFAVNAGIVRDYPLLSNVNPFTSDQFPKLAKVKIRVDGAYHEVTPFDFGTFDTVTELEVVDKYLHGLSLNPLKTDWEAIFPNLKKLDASTTFDGLRIILTKFKNLERLSVAAWRPPDQPLGDILAILSGGRQFGDETQGDKSPYQDEESRTDSLLSLTRLKEFKLEVDPRQLMCDVFVDSDLLQIQPLDNLCLDNVIISDESKEKLQKYHRKTEIYEDRNPNPSMNISKFQEMCII